MRSFFLQFLFCTLFASPALAWPMMDIHEDFTLDYTIPKNVGIRVYGNAKLTIDVAEDGTAPVITSKIFLYDNASFELAGGYADKIELYGESNFIAFTGGRFQGTIDGYSSGQSEFFVNGDTRLNTALRFWEGGTQHFEVRNFIPTYQGPAFYMPSLLTGASFDFYSETPMFNCGDPRANGYGCEIGTWAGSDLKVFVPHPIPWTLNDSDPNRLAGDIDDNGVVDLADLNAVRNYFGTSGSSVGDTLPFDGVVDLSDLNRVRNQFGQVQMQPVPEPSSAVLMVLALVGFAGIPFAHRRHWYLARSL